MSATCRDDRVDGLGRGADAPLAPEGLGDLWFIGKHARMPTHSGPVTWHLLHMTEIVPQVSATAPLEWDMGFYIPDAPKPA